MRLQDIFWFNMLMSCLLFLNVCKHTFHTSHVRIFRNVKGVLM